MSTFYENQDKTNISYLQQDLMIVNEFWDMVSLLETVLAHNKLEDHKAFIIFLSLQNKYIKNYN